MAKATTLFDNDKPLDLDDLDLDNNPSGVGRTHSVRATPTGIRRLNQNGIIIVIAIAFTALILAVMTFNGGNGGNEEKAPVDNGVVNPKGQWYSDIPDSQPVPDLSAASAPVVTAPTAAKESVPLVEQKKPQQTPPAPIDPLIELRKQNRIQALSAGLAAQGFRSISSANAEGLGAGGRATENREISMQNPGEDLLAARLKGFQGQSGEGEDPNMQAHKEQFLKDVQQIGDNDYHKEIRKLPISNYEVKAGTIIPSVMVGGINSDLPGQILAQVRENVYDTKSGQYVLIPQGSRLVGVYDSHVAYGQERVLVAWNRIIYPDGSSLNLKGMPGADAAGYAGLYDQVDNHYFKIFGSAILMSAITAGVQLSQGGLVPGPLQSQSTSQLATSAMGQQLGQTGAQFIQKNMNVQPTLTIRNGEPFNIIVTADLILPIPGKS